MHHQLYSASASEVAGFCDSGIAGDPSDASSIDERGFHTNDGTGFVETAGDRMVVEWVAISKRTLYAAIALLLLMPALGAAAYFWLYRDAPTPTAPSANASLTRFSLVEGEVRVMRHETREVVRAGGDTIIRPGDIVQTLETGRALITLPDGSTLGIRPNSVVTVSETASPREGIPSRVRVAVARGRVEVSTDEQPPEASHTVETRLSKNRLASRTDASFDVFEDRTEEVRVGAGAVESESGGRTTTIGAGEYVARGASGEISRREPLLDAPVLYDPPHMTSIHARPRSPADVTLQWTRPLAQTGVTYRVEIAASPFFVSSGLVFERQELVSTRLVVTELPFGNYFWRVRAISDTGQASAWGGPQRFTIAPSAEAPPR